MTAPSLPEVSGVRTKFASAMLGAMPSHAVRPVGPLAPISCAFASRNLIVELVKREIAARYRTSRFGLAWAFLSPLLLLAVFGFVFGTILQAKWNRPLPAEDGYAFVLFSGLLLFWLLNDCLVRAPGLIRANRQYVTKVVFPLEVLPLVTVLSATFHAALSILVLALAHLVFVGPPPWTIVAAPLVIAPFFLLVLGMSWCLAALGVYMADLEQVVGVLLTALMFVSTVFFPADLAPAGFQSLLYLNPLSWVVDAFRGVALWGELPEPRTLIIAFATGWAAAWLGLVIFQKSRKGFADVL